MIIDFHVHCFPDELAAKATAVLQKKAKVPLWLGGTVGEIKASMQKAGIGRSIILSIATRPVQTENITRWASSIQDESITAFGSIHPDSESWESELTVLKEMGFKGIKLHPDYQNFFVDDEKMFPIYTKAFGLGFIVLFHSGVDIGLPPPTHCTPKRLCRVVKSFPNGKIVAAHMGAFKYWDDVEKYLAGENLYFDTSYSLDWMEREQFCRIILNHGYDKILFGTDSPWSGQAEEISKIKLLELGERVEEAIFGGNAAELLGA